MRVKIMEKWGVHSFDGVESWGVSHPVSIAILSLLISSILTLNFYLPQRIAVFFSPSILDLMVKGEKEIHILQSEISVPQFLHADSGHLSRVGAEKISMPLNVKVTPSDDAAAAQLMASYISGVYGARKRMYRHQQGSPLPTKGLEIFVGGVDANAAADWRWRFYRSKDRNFHFGNLVLGRTSWIINGKPYTAEIQEGGGKKEVIKDYGIAIFFPRLTETGRPGIFICGIWPFGTLAAAEVLTGKIRLSKGEDRKLMDTLHGRSACYVMVECRGRPGSKFSTRVLSVDAFDPREFHSNG